MSFKDHIQSFETLESTMTEGLNAAQNGAPNGTTIIAGSQSGGCGRRGRTWHSAKGAGLFATTVVYPQCPREKAHQLSLVAGVAIHQALTELGAADAKLKWPNDILIQDRKLCGILLECIDLKDNQGPNTQAVLIGYGLNLTAAKDLDLPSDISDLYVGLHGLMDNQPTAQACTELILEKLEAAIEDWSQNGLKATLQYWNSADALQGKTVQAQSANGPINGEACGLDEQGRLILKDETTTHVIDSGEVFQVR
jgi:BirA family biotin operon repressor/biotin-[acetyl-CoA-carboxylase] ligase